MSVVWVNAFLETVSAPHVKKERTKPWQLCRVILRNVSHVQSSPEDLNSTFFPLLPLEVR